MNGHMLTESQKEALVHQMRQTIEIKTGCDANGRCGPDCLCESAAQAILSLELFEHAIYYNKETPSET